MSLRKLLLSCLGFVALFIALVYVAVSVAVLPNMAITVAENPIQGSPADVGLDFTDITLHQQGVRLEGWHMPASKPTAALIFVHGAGSNRTSHFIHSLALYKELVAMGLSVITVDLRNHGSSSKTDGTLSMGLEEWPDVIAMSDWLDTNGYGSHPRLIMGASMGGATAIHALSNGLEVDGAILFDPALDTPDSLSQGGWVRTGMWPGLFDLYAWATTQWYGLPSGKRDAGALGRSLSIPVLLIQDPDDPVTRLPFAGKLAAANPAVDLQIAPKIPEDDPCVAGKGRWGTHVAAFGCHPAWTLAQIRDFVDRRVTPDIQ